MAKKDARETAKRLILLTWCHSFGESGASFLRSRHAHGMNSARSGRHPEGGVAQRSTARLRAVDWSEHVVTIEGQRNDTQRLAPLAALRRSAALDADRVTDGSPTGRRREAAPCEDSPTPKGEAPNTSNIIDRTLKGDLKDYWALTVRANWRVIFRFEDGQARDVDLADGHRMGARSHGHEESAASRRTGRRQSCGAWRIGDGRRQGAQHLAPATPQRDCRALRITPEMAVRLEKALGSTADTWLGMQMNYDLAQIQAKASSLKVTRLAPA